VTSIAAAANPNRSSGAFLQNSWLISTPIRMSRRPA
jgi:hypothetical protein